MTGLSMQLCRQMCRVLDRLTILVLHLHLVEVLRVVRASRSLAPYGVICCICYAIGRWRCNLAFSAR